MRSILSIFHKKCVTKTCHHFLYNKVFISLADEMKILNEPPYSLETKLFSQFCPSIMVHELHTLLLRTKKNKKMEATLCMDGCITSNLNIYNLI